MDLFGGGFNVGVNIQANRTIYNDKQKQIEEMLRYFKNNSLEEMLNKIGTLIDKYQLSKENQKGFLELRKRYNLFYQSDKQDAPLMLYILICFAFNNQIRFNSKGEYNMPFGKNRSSFNPTLRDKFCVFVEKLHENGIEFDSSDFRKLQLPDLSTNDLVYCDPPYFNSTATYNENGSWQEKDEKDLLNILDKVNDRGIKFALSNNLTTNPTLKEWTEKHNYTIHYLNCNYSNCNYQKKDRIKRDVEVLITNYK